MNDRTNYDIELYCRDAVSNVLLTAHSAPADALVLAWLNAGRIILSDLSDNDGRVYECDQVTATEFIDAAMDAGLAIGLSQSDQLREEFDGTREPRGRFNANGECWEMKLALLLLIPCFCIAEEYALA